MIDKVNRLFDRIFGAPKPAPYPMDPTPPDATAALQDHTCFYCGAEDSFVRGPQGGSAVNIMCTVCGQRLNVLDGSCTVIEVQAPAHAVRALYAANPAAKHPRTDRFHYWYEDKTDV